MDDWGVWLIVAVLLAAGEIIISAGFILGPISIAALCSAIVAVLGGSVELQLAVFAGASLLLLAGLRPIARRHLEVPPLSRTGAAALIDQVGLVLEPIGVDHSGLVRVSNENWTSRLAPGEEPIEADARVVVIEIQGATAIVARKQD